MPILDQCVPLNLEAIFLFLDTKPLHTYKNIMLGT